MHGPETGSNTVTKKMRFRRIGADLRLHEALITADISENDSRRASFYLLGVLRLCYFDFHVDFTSSNRPLFGGKGGGLSRHHTVRVMGGAIFVRYAHRHLSC